MIDKLSSLAITQDIAQTLVALRTTEHRLQGDDDKPTPSTLTALIDELNCMEKRIAGNADPPTATALSDVLSKYLYARNSIHPAVRSPATKLLVSGVLTLTFVTAATNRSETMGEKRMFAIANAIATANSLQDEALGEVIAAADKAVTEMRQLAMPVALNLERIAAPNGDKPTGYRRPVTQVMRWLLQDK